MSLDILGALAGEAHPSYRAPSRLPSIATGLATGYFRWGIDCASARRLTATFSANGAKPWLRKWASKGVGSALSNSNTVCQ
jgi:hypothetical protein